MPSVLEFIQALERRGTIQSSDAARLRQLQEAAPQEFVPRVMLRWLVNRGRLSAEQAQQLLAAPENASVEGILDQVLGHDVELELQSLSSEDHEPDEDTKDLIPATDDEPLTLPKRGTPTFQGGDEFQKRQAAEKKPPGKNAESLPPPKPRRDSKPATEPIAEITGLGVYANEIDALFSSADGVDLLAVPPSLRSSRKKRGARGWDSPLMLVGGGCLLVLVLGGAFLLWRIGRQSGDDAFAAAEAAYAGGAYARALELYDQFLTKYPKHISADRGAVHRGLSRIRLAVEGTTDWPKARRTAAEVLQEISPNEDFGSAHADLSVLLPEIAQNLAKSALESGDDATFVEAKEAYQLVTKYLPPSDVLNQRVTQIQTLLTLNERLRERSVKARSAAMEIDGMIAEDDFLDAYRLKEELLKADAEAAAIPELRAALQSLAAASARGVKFVAAPVESLLEERPGVIQASKVLTERSGTPVEALRGRVGFVTAGGVVFALDAESGRILWRRTVGFDGNVGPLPLSAATDADTLLHDSRYREFVIVETATGKLRRRIPLPTGDDTSGNRVWAVVHGSRLLVTCESGRVYSFDTVTGKADGYLSFPQRLAECVTADTRGQVFYQFAATGTLYILSATDFRCLQSLDVGHGESSLTTAPLSVSSRLLFFERVQEAGRMRIWETDKQGLNPQEVGRRDFSAPILSPGQVSQRFVAVVDLSGKLEAFDLSQRDTEALARPVAEHQCAGGNRIRRHLVFQGNQLWAAGTQCERLELQPTLNKISLKRAFMGGIVSQSAPGVYGEHVFLSWRKPNQDGCYAGAFAAASGIESWQTELAAPLSAPPLYDAASKQIICVRENTTSPALYAFAAADTGATSELAAPSQTLEGIKHIQGAQLLPRAPAGSVLLSISEGVNAAGPSQLLVVERGDGTQLPPLRTIDLPDPGASAPALFHDDAVVATKLGQVQVWNIATGKPAAGFFQPPLIAGNDYSWTRPEVNGDSLYISDRTSRLYRLTRETKPEPRILSAAEAPLARALVGDPAVVGNMLYVADETQTLLGFQLPDLRPGPSWDLGEPLEWGGPVRSGKLVFAATAADQGLVCKALDGEGNLLWTTPLHSGAWPPVTVGDKLYVVDVFGGVSRLDPATGKELNRTETGLALAQPPAVCEERIVLTTSAGELVWITLP